MYSVHSVGDSGSGKLRIEMNAAAQEMRDGNQKTGPEQQTSVDTTHTRTLNEYWKKIW